MGIAICGIEFSGSSGCQDFMKLLLRSGLPSDTSFGCSNGSVIAGSCMLSHGGVQAQSGCTEAQSNCSEPSALQGAQVFGVYPPSEYIKAQGSDSKD